MTKNYSDFLAIGKKCDAIREVLEQATKDAADEDFWGMLYPV